MLKTVGVRLEEELIKRIKVHALENTTSMQDVITKALEQYLSPKPQVQEKPVKFYDFRLTEQHVQAVNNIVATMRIQLKDQRR